MDIVDCKYHLVPHFLECSPNIDITNTNTLLASTLIIGIYIFWNAPNVVAKVKVCFLVGT